MSAKTKAVVGALGLIAMTVSGCALTPGHVNVSYTPLGSSGTIRPAGAEAVSVHVAVSDQRASKDAVGHKTNGYGMEMAPITSDNDIPQTLQSAIESELKSHGFNIVEAGPTIAVALTKFENRFVNGFWSGTATAELVMNVVVQRPDGGIVYTKLIDVQGVNPGIQLSSAENAGIALDRALQGGIAQLFEDSAFPTALRTAGKNGAPATHATDARVSPAASHSPMTTESN